MKDKFNIWMKDTDCKEYFTKLEDFILKEKVAPSFQMELKNMNLNEKLYD